MFPKSARHCFTNGILTRKYYPIFCREKYMNEDTVKYSCNSTLMHIKNPAIELKGSPVFNLTKVSSILSSNGNSVFLVGWLGNSPNNNANTLRETDVRSVSFSSDNEKYPPKLVVFLLGPVFESVYCFLTTKL